MAKLDYECENLSRNLQQLLLKFGIDEDWSETMIELIESEQPKSQITNVLIQDCFIFYSNLDAPKKIRFIREFSDIIMED